MDKMKYTDKEIRMFKNFRDFYIIKHQYNYSKALKEIKSLGIKRIDVVDDFITIHLYRPGVLIGKYGENIQNLKEYMKQFDIKDIIIIEDEFDNFILPYRYDDEI